MAVRFILGRAGSGKTHHCLQGVRRRLHPDPVDGPRLILLVPEQASLQMERAILVPFSTDGDGDSDGSTVSASHRAEVLSFQRLAFRVLESVGGPIRIALSETARAMVLRHILRRHADRLEYYRRPERAGGFVERLGATITELIQEAVTAEDLSAFCREAGEGASMDPTSEAKLHDLQLIFAAYVDYLGEERLDPSQHLEVARSCLGRCEWLAGARLWVDGFASLSEQETQMLVSLARLCDEVEVTMLADPDIAGGSRNVDKGIASAELFARTRETYEQLRREFEHGGVELLEPLIFAPPVPPRFALSPSLACLERSLFANSSGESVTSKSCAVELVELPSRRVEVDYAVSRICQWVQRAERPLRYRDVAIIVRDLEPYHDLLCDALNSRDIPFFLDRRRPVAHHPLVELLRAGIDAAAESLSMDSVRRLLKTGLVPVSTQEADALENYVLAHGVSGREAWAGDDWTWRDRRGGNLEKNSATDTWVDEELARVNRARRTVFAYVEQWLSASDTRSGHTGAEWSEAIHRWLKRLEVATTLQGWADDAEQVGELDQAEEHRQVWRDVMSFVDDLGFALADVSLTIDELADVVESGLSGLTLGLVPPMVDQVLLGSIQRSRHPDIKAALILGFNDGVFPQRFVEDSILNDDDRERLRSGGIPVGPPARERVLDESLLVYIALTRASERVVVTFATMDDAGQELRASPYLDAIRSACGGLDVERLGDPNRGREAWDLLGPRDLRRRLAEEFRSRPTLAEDDGPTRRMWNGLYEHVREGLEQDATTRRALSSLAPQPAARLSVSSVDRLFNRPLRTSVSQLETYAACPFQHFGRYVLRLRERQEAALAPVDVGQIHHAILEDFVGGLRTRRQGLTALGDEELHRGLIESCDRVSTRLFQGGAVSHGRDAYVLRRAAGRIARVIRAQGRIALAGKARPHASEVPYGFDRSGGMPAFEVSTPSGERVLLRGFIDRVDLIELADELLGVVVDYKETRAEKRLDLSRVYHGLSLQLPAYLIALAEGGETLAGRPIRPIAALYVSLAPRYQSVAHPDQPESRDVGLGGTYRPRGMLRGDALAALDADHTTGWSQHYAAFLSKDGGLGHVDKSDAATPRDFDATLAHTRDKLGQLAGGILDGDVAVNPYRLGDQSPCSWCALGSVCRFEMGISQVRFLDSLKRSQVFARLTLGSS